MSIGRIGARDDGVTTLETFRYNASGGETSLSGADAGGRSLVYPINYEAVYLNGVRLVRGQDYTATTGSSITGLSALASGDIVEILVFQALDLADALTQGEADSYYVRKDLVDAKGDLLVASAADTITRVAAGTDGFVLTADSTQSTGVRWAVASGGVGFDAVFMLMGA